MRERRIVGQARYGRRLVIAVVVAALVALGMGSSALATPGDEFVVFKQCPVHTYRVTGCFYAPIGSGYLTLGKTVVPIAKTVVLQGGMLKESEEEEGVRQLAPALDGETLTKVGQTLPGGLFGGPLDAVTELAAPASSILLSRGLDLSLILPIKLRLVNPLLGPECSIGSNAHPIDLRLTTGTNADLTGNPGEETSIEEGKIAVLSGVSMVSSGFAVPKASGCESAVVDEAVDAKLGLPSDENTVATFNMKIETANSGAVEVSEG
jgi:hypothetical protein